MKTNEISSVSSRNSSPRPGRVSPRDSSTTEFGATLNQLLGTHGRRDLVSEEDLFAAAVGQQIKDQFGDDIFGQYKERFQGSLGGAAPGHSGPSSEYAAKRATRGLIKSGSMTSDQAASITSSANLVAQLDDKSQLYDAISRGAGDDTKAATQFYRAETSLDQRLSALRVNPKYRR